MRVVVVGGGAAGMSCASLLRRRRPEIHVTVLEQGSFVSFSACGMPFWLAGEVQGGPDRLVVLPAERAREERGIDVRTHTTVTEVQPDDYRAIFEGPQGGGEESYDALVIATGAGALEPFGATHAPNVWTFRHLDDGVEAQTFLEEEADGAEEAVVVGGGFVGLEMGHALVRRGLEAVVVEAEDTLVEGRLQPELSEVLEHRMREDGVSLRTGTRVEDVRLEEGRAVGVSLGQEQLSADIVVVATGTRPRSGLAKAAGCRLTDAGAVLVDEQMRTSVEDVYACGDCVAYPNRLTGEHERWPLALHANRSGRTAGEAIVGNQPRFPGVLGTAVTRVAGTEIAFTGLTEAEARAAGYTPVSATIEGLTRAGYHPEAGPIHVHLVAEEATGRVLGGQVVGGPGSGKRIDTLAAALWMEARCEDVEAMDLGYSPAVSPTWDPVAIAARVVDGERVG